MKNFLNIKRYKYDYGANISGYIGQIFHSRNMY